MPRVPAPVARFGQHAIDAVVLMAAYLGAFVVRFEGAIPERVRATLLVSFPIVLIVQVGMLRVYDVHRVAWRYVNLRDTRRILMAVGVATLVLLSIRTVIGHSAFGPVLQHWKDIGYASSPIGVLIVDAVLAFCGLVGVRALRRLESERSEAKQRVTNGTAVTTLLVGAGRAGALVAREIVSRPDVGLDPVAFVDDDPAKIGTHIGGIPVLGTTSQIARIAEKLNAKQVLISMASAPGQDLRRVVKICEDAKLRVKIIPGIFEMINGSVSLNRIRDVAIEDLLRREPVDLDIDGISKFLRGRCVLITGAGGSIGSELCRQVARFQPSKLLLVERSENNLFFIDRELTESFPDLDLVPCIADVCDSARLDEIFSEHHPHTVFHAAAHKHVPMMELNPAEAVKNNVFGTITIADTADRYAVSEFVLISTDKAVKPVSVMGATKRAAEIYIQALSTRSDTKFVAVRFGNVLGSAGSVVPIFREQIRKGGPITVTHPDMRRYFMTIPEATQLVLQAAAVGETGEVLILDMGEPIRMVDLARDMIRLSGLREGEDIEIVFTGIRPGERLFEELYADDEIIDRSRHPRIFVGKVAPAAWELVASAVAQTRGHLERAKHDGVLIGLRAMVAEYRPAKSSSATPEPEQVQ